MGCIVHCAEMRVIESIRLSVIGLYGDDIAVAGTLKYRFRLCSRKYTPDRSLYYNSSIWNNSVTLFLARYRFISLLLVADKL